MKTYTQFLKESKHINESKDVDGALMQMEKLVTKGVVKISTMKTHPSGGIDSYIATWDSSNSKIFLRGRTDKEEHKDWKEGFKSRFGERRGSTITVMSNMPAGLVDVVNMAQGTNFS